MQLQNIYFFHFLKVMKLRSILPHMVEKNFTYEHIKFLFHLHALVYIYLAFQIHLHTLFHHH